MLEVNKIGTDVNNRISYKKHIEGLQEESDYLKGEIIEKNKIICNLTSAMTKNPSTPLQGSKSPWLPSAKANEFIDHNTSTPPLCLDANTPKLNFLKNPLYNGENYVNLSHSNELLNSKIKSILMHEYQHKSTRINTNQHLCDTTQHESTRV